MYAPVEVDRTSVSTPAVLSDVLSGSQPVEEAKQSSQNIALLAMVWENK